MSDADGFVRAIGAEDLEPGCGACVEIAGLRLAIFNIDQEFLAIDDECPHQGGPLSEGEADQGVVTCPWHSWEFDLRTGQNDDDPETRVRTYDVRVQGGDVLVRIPQQEPQPSAESQ